MKLILLIIMCLFCLAEKKEEKVADVSAKDDVSAVIEFPMTPLIQINN